MSKEYDSSVIAYTTKGLPITKLELKNRVKAASKRVKSGDFIAHDELEKEIESFQKLAYA